MHYTYDKANNMMSMTDGRGSTATMTYDALERTLTKIYPNTINSKDENVTYTYDNCAFGKGYLCGKDDESGHMLILTTQQAYYRPPKPLMGLP